jgi:hypothetical protein
MYGGEEDNQRGRGRRGGHWALVSGPVTKFFVSGSISTRD